MIHSILLSALVFSASFAHAKNIDVCIRLGEALSSNQSEYDRAKTAVENSKYICEGSKDEAACSAQLLKHLEKESEFLASSRKSFHEAGCDDGSAAW